MSTTVCITALDDGQYKVWTEADETPEAPEPAPPGGPAAPAMAPADPAAMPEAPEGGETGAQVVKDLKSALTLAMEALKSGGQMSDMSGQQQAFQDGFGQGAV